MAIVKAKYVRGKTRIKAHLRYITHRKGLDVGAHHPATVRQGWAPVKTANLRDDRRGPPWRNIHKFVFNFHPVKEDTRKDLNLWEITKKTLEHIKTQFGNSVPFVATIHDDHTLLRHVHGFFIVEGRLSKEEFSKIKWLMEDRLSRSMAPAPAP